MRKDGRRVKTVQPMYQVVAHIMSERSDSMNMIKEMLPTEPIQQFLNKARKEGKRYSHLSVIIAATVRMISQYPFLNRFVVNKRIYARNEIAIGMVVLMPGKDEGTMNKMYFKPDMTLEEVQQVIEKYIDDNREEGDTNQTDDIIRKLLAIPGLCRLGVNLFKFMDKHGLLPRALIEASPFHATMTITNLASIGTNYIYHHVYNFGTTSMLAAIGNAEYVPKKKKGEIVFEKCLPMGVVMDERIADGCQFAIAFKYMEKLLADPTLLEVRPETVKEDLP